MERGADNGIFEVRTETPSILAKACGESINSNTEVYSLMVSRSVNSVVIRKHVVRPKVVKGEVKAKIKISPVVVFGVLSRMVLVRGS